MLEQLDGAEIRECAHDQSSEARNDGVVIERLVEERPGLGEERRVPLGLLGPAPRRALVGQELGIPQRDRRLRREEFEHHELVLRECPGDEVVLEIDETRCFAVEQERQAEDGPSPAPDEIRIFSESVRLRGIIQDERRFGLPRISDDGRWEMPGVRCRERRPGNLHAAIGRRRLELDEERPIAANEETSPLGATLLENDVEQRLRNLVPDDLLRDRLGCLGNGKKIDLLDGNVDRRERSEWTLPQLRICALELRDLAVGSPSEVAVARLAQLRIRDPLDAFLTVEASGEFVREGLELHEAMRTRELRRTIVAAGSIDRGPTQTSKLGFDERLAGRERRWILGGPFDDLGVERFDLLLHLRTLRVREAVSKRCERQRVVEVKVVNLHVTEGRPEQPLALDPCVTGLLVVTEHERRHQVDGVMPADHGGSASGQPPVAFRDGRFGRARRWDAPVHRADVAQAIEDDVNGVEDPMLTNDLQTGHRFPLDVL